ncbi:MAG: HAMP domain-containing sensor histidine kinase [Chloroflexales bacterium]
MAHPISAFMARLQQAGAGVVSGCYTPATIAHLGQSLTHMAFADGESTLLVAGSDQQRAWADLALRGVDAQVQRVDLSAAPNLGAGFILIGVGATLGFALLAYPIEPVDRDESVRLHDVIWSCGPAALRDLADMLRDAISADLARRIAALEEPGPAALLGLSSDLLDFAARQHSTLGVANRSLSERMRNQEDQTRMIVHDMRAPLHTLLISIKALQRQRFDPEGQNELLSVARDSANYLLTLTETVLDSARLETSGWSLKRQPVRLLNLVQSVCDPLELAARPDQARLRHIVADDMPMVWIDRTLMERVLTNLITNAIKYTPSGEISVAARLIHEGNTVEISVNDTGLGIPKEAQAHIFERFYQANDSDRRHGTGLGLYFCRLAVEAHGGSIAVQSAVGQGSTFIVSLPITSGDRQRDDEG